MKTKHLFDPLFNSLLLAVISLFACLSLPDRAHGYTTYNNYREIPGVTAEEISKIEEVKTSRKQFVFGMVWTNEAFVQEDGSIGGFTRYFCEWLSGIFGISLEPQLYRREDLTAAIHSGEVDFTGEYFDECEQDHASAGPIINRPVLRFRMRNALNPDRVARWRKLHYGFPEEFGTLELVAKNVIEPFEARLYEDRSQAIEALSSGTIDAFVMDTRGRAPFEGRSDIIEELFFPLTYSPASIMTAQPELEPFLHVIEKFLAAGGASMFEEMFALGELEYNRMRLRSLLDDDELAYVAKMTESATKIPIALELENYPVCFFNHHTEEWHGIAIDVIDEIKALTDLDFEPVGQTYSEWRNVAEILPTDRVAMASELLFTNKRRGLFLWADTPYSTDNFALISLIEREPVRVNEIPDLKVGVLRDSAYEDIFRECFPNANPIPVDSRTEAFDRLDAGNLDLFMGSGNILLEVTNYMERPNFKINYIFDIPCESAFGFDIREPLLRGIVSKAQLMVNTEDIANEWRFRTFDYRQLAIDRLRPYLTAAIALLAVILLVILALFAKNRRIRADLERKVLDRTDKLNRMTVAANAATTAKSEFLSRISKEMCRPLDAIVGMSKDIRAAEQAPDRKKLAERIDRASKHLLSVINDILEMSHIESDSQKTIRGKFDMAETLDNISAIADYLASERSQRVLISVAGDVPKRIVGDESHIAQVLANLLSNSFKFAPEGSDIKVDVSRVGEPALDPDKILLRFAVIDGGTSKSQEELDNLIRTIKEDCSGRRSERRTHGTGLPISVTLVEAMSGEFKTEVDSCGTTFSFVIPVEPVEVDDPEQPAEEPSPEAQPAEGGSEAVRRVIVADDVDINREIVEAYLEDLPFSLDFAENGREAVELFERSPDGYDIILMDIQMPEMNGLDATLAIRASGVGRAKTVPIIALTANVFKEDIEKYMEAGMNDHIGKPIDPAELMEKLSKHLKQ